MTIKLDSRSAMQETPSSVVNQLSLKKLLNSHLSIYNALTNPDLDVGDTASSPRLTPGSESPVSKDNQLIATSPDLKDLQFSATSWETISNESLHQNFTPSPVLSVTSDEDDMPILVNWRRHLLPSQNLKMVLELDEDFDELSTTSFIMPKLPVSCSLGVNKKIEITVISSSNAFAVETNQLVRKIESEINFDQIRIRHLTLGADTSKFDEMTLLKSDLIFIINDGSSKFVELLSNIEFDEECLPKLTIINMITNNYFVNLFELITNLRPYQIWKASSLKQENFIDKFKNFIEIEIDLYDGEITRNAFSAPTSNIPAKSTSRDHNGLTVSRGYYSELVVAPRADYRSMEKSFKSELKDSTSLNDPLQFSSNLGPFKIFVSIFNRVICSSSKIWVICSFGIGVGLGMAGGLALFKYTLNDVRINLENPVLAAGKTLVNSVNESNNFATDHDIFDKLVSLLSVYTNDVKLFSSYVVECVKGGLVKFADLLLL